MKNEKSIGCLTRRADCGDLMTLAGGVFFALHIIAVSHFSNGRDSVPLTIFQFTSSGICALVVALIFERDGVTGELNGELVLGVAYLAVCCTAIALFFRISDKSIPSRRPRLCCCSSNRCSA